MRHKLYSIFNFKCPRCLKGSFFTHHPYNLKHVGEIYEKCSCCDLKYEREPGFYYGGMYVSYALGVALFVTFWVSFSFFIPNVDAGWQIGIISITVLFLSPLMYALSKIIWANFFIKYDPEQAAKCKDKNLKA